jgi:hypothetical protein
MKMVLLLLTSYLKLDTTGSVIVNLGCAQLASRIEITTININFATVSFIFDLLFKLFTIYSYRTFDGIMRMYYVALLLDLIRKCTIRAVVFILMVDLTPEIFTTPSVKRILT